MARKSEAEQLLREGHYPSEIARRMAISVKSVIQYLRTRVGEGALRLSDLYFSWPQETRAILQQAGQGAKRDDRFLKTAIHHGLFALGGVAFERFAGPFSGRRVGVVSWWP